jgi:Leucine-rich repeat (LRR) protein
MSSIEANIVPAIRSQSKKLNFSCKSLKYLPKSIGRVESCEKLYLQSNKLNDLPPEIGYLFKIIILNIGNNQFEDIPSCLFQLKNMEQFLAYQNQLKSIHPGICYYLRKLTIINFNNNLITYVPPDISRYVC